MSAQRAGQVSVLTRLRSNAWAGAEIARRWSRVLSGLGALSRSRVSLFALHAALLVRSWKAVVKTACRCVLFVPAGNSADTKKYDMSLVTIRPISHRDLDTFVDAQCNLPESELERWVGFIPDRTQALRQTFDDPDFAPELFLGAWDGDRLAGSVLGIRRPWKEGKESTGFVKWIWVCPSYRRQGIGRKLLTACERGLSEAVGETQNGTRKTEELGSLAGAEAREQATGPSPNPESSNVHRASLGKAVSGRLTLVFGSSSPRYLVPGVPEQSPAARKLFHACGWQEVSRRISLRVPLSQQRSVGPGKENFGAKASRTMAGAFHIRLAETTDRAAASSFIHSVFSASWGEEVAPSFDEKTSGAFCSLLWDQDANKILGFAAVGATNTGWFGPMGVHPEHRRRGFGSRLVQHACNESRRRGLKQLMFPWINENEAFYRRVLDTRVERIVFLKTEKQLHGT